MDDTALDGKYQVTTTSNYDGPIPRKSDGVTEIRNGRTLRVDAAGVQWSSTFKILSDTEVEMVSVADPTKAKPGHSLKRPDGSPSLEPITYTSKLKFARKGDKIQLSGQIHYGDEIIFLTMRKSGP